VGILASGVHKVLSDAGIRLGVVVSDLHGHSARLMVKALIAGKSVPEVLDFASNHLPVVRRYSRLEALQAEEFTPAHRFTLTQTMTISSISKKVSPALRPSCYAACVRRATVCPCLRWPDLRDS
jgi:hypothetical protein